LIRTAASTPFTFNPGTQKLTAGGDIEGRTLTSTVATGTAPLTVSSTTKVTNLNADLLDGFDSASTNTVSTIVARDSSGNFSANVITCVDVNSTSDIKLKTNIRTLTNSLNKVLSMRGVEFDRIDLSNKHQVGVIAQEIEAIVPELVSEDSEGTKTVAYGKITSLLIEAIKELTEKVKVLEENSKY
jgi:hypothetical protein